MDQIFISDLLARGVIGISDRERAQPQDILINAVIFTDISRVSHTDDLADTVNYRDLAKKLIAHAQTAERYTVEALAADLAALVLEEPGALGVRMRVEKPGAVRFSRSVGVEIERYKAA